jgi:MFS family permease
LALLAFAAGFSVRPFGALVFGRLGDLVGRKHTFLLTIILMGVAAGLVGVLPAYASIGVAVPIILVVSHDVPDHGGHRNTQSAGVWNVGGVVGGVIPGAHSVHVDVAARTDRSKFRIVPVANSGVSLLVSRHR